jgi:hypothetical protein
VSKRNAKERKRLLKLDLGCGDLPKEGFTGVDISSSKSAIKCDLTKFPWPWTEESVEEVFCCHFLEHVPGKLRIPFMDELWRILIPEGVATIVVPYWSSARSVQDPTHEWPPISEQSFLYFNKQWRIDNKLTHYLGTCDFDFTYGHSLDPETAARADEVRMSWIKHYLNAASDLQVIMTKKVR